jgi:hypothetical protein
MKDAFELPFKGPSPLTTTAASDIMVATCQRSLALHAELLDQLVSRSLDHTRQGGDASESKPGLGVMGTWMAGDAMRSCVVGPMWRYMIGMMSLGRNASTTMTSLVTAQMRGSQEELHSLSQVAHDDAERAAVDAAAATGSAMSCCMNAVGKLGEIAAHNASSAAATASAAGHEAGNGGAARRGAAHSGRASARSGAH